MAFHSSSNTSRQSRMYVASKCISLVKSNDEQNQFTASELINIEERLRDEFTKNLWLYELCNVLAKDGACVPKAHINAYALRDTNGPSQVSEKQLSDVKNQFKFLDEKFKLIKSREMKLQKIFLNKTDASIESRVTSDLMQRNAFACESKANELISQLIKDYDNRPKMRNSKEIVNDIMKRFESIPMDKDFNIWINGLYDEMALCCGDKSIRIENVNFRLYEKLKKLRENLIAFTNECHGICKYYSDVCDEMSWRNDFKRMIDEINDKYNENSGKIPIKMINYQLNHIQSDGIFEKFERNESDDLEKLIEKLKENIDILEKLHRMKSE